MERFLKTLTCAALLATPFAAAAADKPGSAIDLYYVPQAEGELVVPGLGADSSDGDGFGARGLFHAGEAALITGEYQTVTYDDDGGETDFDQIRVGAGLRTSNVFAAYVEYVKADLSEIFEADGFAIHARIAADVAPTVELYGDAGYLMLDGEYDGTGGFSEDLEGFEFTVGAAFAFSPAAGAFLDYRRTTLEGDQTQIEFETGDVRAGLRLAFGG